MARAEFVRSFELACEKAGGYPSWGRYKDKTLYEVMEVLAPNGVRFHHDQNATIDVFERLLEKINK
jgi:hypothetical protein